MCVWYYSIRGSESFLKGVLQFKGDLKEELKRSKNKREHTENTFFITGVVEDCVTPEEPADIAADEAEEHVDVDSDPATQQGLVTQEHQDGHYQEHQGEDVANITEHQYIRP